jgi:hypothetical protein
MNEINNRIAELKKNGPVDTNSISDGYHTFGELYEHRCALWFKLCEMLYDIDNDRGEIQKVWKTKIHSDGSAYEGWFLLGYEEEKGKQITYHLPMEYWDKCYFAIELAQAPEFDGHTSADVLERLKAL